VGFNDEEIVNKIILSEMIKDIKDDIEKSDQKQVFVDANEKKIISGAFELNKVTIGMSMKSLENVYCIELNTKISKELILEIYHNG